MPNALPPVPLPKLIFQVVATLVITALILFVPAGTLDWPHAWWFIAVMTAAMITAIAYILRVNPEIVAARQKFGEGTKGWDMILVSLVLVGLIAICPVAGLEIRFGGTPLPIAVVIVGHALFIGGFVIMTWAQGANRHFEPTARLQSEREHTVVDKGPYAHVRHPGYISGSMFGLGMALALGSAWAVVPALVTIAALVVRTNFEDRMLHEELTGYPDYARRVRYRWLPGIW